ncbi:hypothetical protein GWZ69_00085 [Vibrio cholerae]|nr:hypothetical protein [Vibrio cholerae]
MNPRSLNKKSFGLTRCHLKNGELSGLKSYRINHAHNKRLKRDCQRAAFPVPMSRGGCSCRV